MVPLKIDFVSDVSCPWCVVGLRSLEIALDRLADEAQSTVHLQPYELNPHMPPEGEDLGEYIHRKYGSSPQESAAVRETLRGRGADLGFAFNYRADHRVYNTFDAHRLLHWAAEEGRQQELKHALFRAYFTEGENPSDPAVLVRVAGEVGLDPERAKQILASTEYSEEVRALQRRYRKLGIEAVPSVIVNDRHLIQGGQPPEVFERVLRRLIEEDATTAT
jgi:predicted DsbA family dithiol-disulfide isomerase